MKFLVIVLSLILFNACSAYERIKENFINKSDDPKCLLIVKKDQKISRNDRCEATGKKFKNCCGGL